MLTFLQHPAARKRFAETVVDGKVSSTGRRYLKNALDVLEYYRGREGDDFNLFIGHLLQHKKIRALQLLGLFVHCLLASHLPIVFYKISKDCRNKSCHHYLCKPERKPLCNQES